MLFLKDNFTFHPLSSETLLKVPACYYEQKSSVNAEMLYPLLLPPCHRWILKRSIIKKKYIYMLGMQHPLPAACGKDPLGFAQLVPRGCCFQPPLLLLLDVPCPLVPEAVGFLLFPPPLSPLRGRRGRKRVPWRARLTPQRGPRKVIFTHLKIAKQTIKNASNPK